MKFNCPVCSKSLRVSDERAGKKGRCPGCKSVVKIPQLRELPSEATANNIATPPPLPTPDRSFDLVQDGRKKLQWKMSLYGDRLTLFCRQTQDFLEIPRDQSTDKIKTIRIFAMPPALTIKDAREKLNFKITPELYNIVNEWIGKSRLLQATLKQRFSWCLPIGIVYIFSSLPLSSDAEAGLGPLSFDPIGALLGITLILLSIMMKVKPHPLLFLADSAWFLLLLCYSAWQIMNGASIYWIIAIGLQMMLIISGVGHYRNFVSE